MYPHERSLVKNLAGKPFALIGVNSDDDYEIPQKLVKDGTVTWRSFWNGEDGTKGPISSAFKVRGWPTVLLLDGKGVVRFVNPQRGPGDGMKALDEAIAELLAEMGEEFPTEQIDADTETEKKKFASTAGPGNIAGQDREARMAAVRARHAAKRAKEKAEKEANEETDEEESQDNEDD